MKSALKTSWLYLSCLAACADQPGPMGLAGPSSRDAGGDVEADVDPSESGDDETADDDDDIEPDASVSASDGSAARAPTFGSVFAILTVHCLECHGAEGEIFGELSFENRSVAHRQLVGSLALGTLCSDGKRRRVVAGEPDASLIVQKMEDTQDCGLRMPTHGDPLPSEDIGLIREWISLGAKRD